jgi:hypothetical protein
MICIDINPEFIRKAAQRSIELGRLNGSYMDGQRNIVGFVAEEIYQSIFPDSIRDNNYDYDFKLKGKKIDIKARSITKPPHNACTFTFKSLKKNQDVDFYVFFFISIDFKKAWLLGYLRHDELSNFPYIQVGDVLSSGVNAKQSGYNIKVTEFNKMEVIIK